MEQQERIGLFIRDMRLERGLTQQQLAGRLGITDKAVSKWERNISCPDITLLRDLADALGVSVSELLAGQREGAPPPVPPEVQDAVLEAVQYAETARRKNGGWRFWTFVALTASCLVAAVPLLILYALLGNPYLLLALKSVAFGWALCYPLLRLEKRPVGGCLAVLTFSIIPFLLQIRDSYPASIYWIVLLSVAYLWAVYGLFRRLRLWRAAAGGILLGGLLGYVINAILNLPVHPANVAGSVMSAAACLLIDFTLSRSRRE